LAPVLEQLGLLPLLLGYQYPHLDHLERTAGALTGTQILQDQLVFPFPIEVVAGILLERGLEAVGNQFVLQFGIPHPINVLPEAFSILPVPSPDLDEM